MGKHARTNEPFIFVWIREMIPQLPGPVEDSQHLSDRNFYLLMALAGAGALLYAWASGLFNVAGR